MTRYNCSIGNPFSGPGMIELRVNLEPSDLIIGNENNASIDFTVSSINPENTTTIEDNSNFATTQLEFEAKANITIDNGYRTMHVHENFLLPLSSLPHFPHFSLSFFPSLVINYALLQIYAVLSHLNKYLILTILC